MREKSITGKYIGNAIGYCHCKAHTGALNKELAYKHKNVLLSGANGLRSTMMRRGEEKKGMCGNEKQNV